MIVQETADREILDHRLLAHDLAVLEDMVVHMGGYLMTEATRWDIGKSGAPPITIGGYLMRRRRLGLLAPRLDADERHRLDEANADFDRVVTNQTVRFEHRTLAEIGDRLREWGVYLRHLAGSARMAADHAHYAWKADTRVVVGDLIAVARERRLALPGHIPTDLAALDHRLQGHWQPGAFIWAPVWELAYPAEPYWWLYGSPTAA